MDIKLHLGWWLLPFLITIITFGKLSIYCAKRKSGGDYDFGVDILLLGAGAAIISLTAWLIYFIIK